jgi:hypothetical protein
MQYTPNKNTTNSNIGATSSAVNMQDHVQLSQTKEIKSEHSFRP